MCVALVLGLGFFLTRFLHDPDINGRTGITVDAQGHPIVVAEICHGTVKRVRIYGPNPGAGKHDPVDADLSTAPQKTSFTLDPSSPGSAWDGQPLNLPVADEMHSVILNTGNKSQLQEVTFTPQDLAALRPGTVQFDTYTRYEVGHSTVNIADFHRLACGK